MSVGNKRQSYVAFGSTPKRFVEFDATGGRVGEFAINSVTNWKKLFQFPAGNRNWIVGAWGVWLLDDFDRVKCHIRRGADRRWLTSVNGADMCPIDGSLVFAHSDQMEGEQRLTVVSPEGETKKMIRLDSYIMGVSFRGECLFVNGIDNLAFYRRDGTLLARAKSPRKSH